MTRPENGLLDFIDFTGYSRTSVALEVGDVGSKEKDWRLLNEEEKSLNSLEHPLLAITSTLPLPIPPIFVNSSFNFEMKIKTNVCF